ncbi:MAG: thymidine kinase [Candidatus Cloacimonetes bacterium]|nr:thymidine kinase [Candidatus Cloacimonadota bacterium]
MNIIRQKTGWIEVICGSMFSGKTEELIKRIRRAEYARQKIQVFKPVIDNRYAVDRIVSHSQMSASSINITKPEEIYEHLEEDTQFIGIDEAQFFDESIVDVANELARQGKRVVIAGLDQDYMGKPFGPMPQLLAVAEYITKNLAICMKCGNPANRTQRLTKDSDTILVGADEIYEARCRNCHEILE